MFQGGLVFKTHRLLYHSTLGSSVIKRDTINRVQRWSGRGEGHLENALDQSSVTGLARQLEKFLHVRAQVPHLALSTQMRQMQ